MPKVDIEGADKLCLEGLLEAAAAPQFVSLESNRTDFSELRREFAILRELGYSRFKVIDQTRVSEQRPPRPAREGSFTDQSFVIGMTGLFGDESPRDWVSEQVSLRRLKIIFWHYRLFRDGPFRGLGKRMAPLPFFWRYAHKCAVGWYDTHAALGRG